MSLSVDVAVWAMGGLYLSLAPSLVRGATGSTSTLIAGSGFGAGFLGALRSVVPLALPHERAGLMSAFYVLSYLAFCLPSLLAGNLIRSFGLIVTTDGYGAVLILLSLGALVGLLLQESARAKATTRG